ncbi:hypothetical protein RJ640_024337 [Escallonia rubra]|uniref:CASP-like protein n=1 Tax=Escallonia rubra TaxID=112253 RepID=A0AA88S0W1_9ASTE|nr:hypothetical protein RJ640_024337 [Escallonia rubra]
MENRNKQATSDTSPTTSDNHRRPTRSPEHSPDSSLSSDTSSLSHGFSPREENLPPLFAPKHNPSTPPSPVLVPMVNRYVHDEPVAPKKVESRAGAVEEGGGGGGRRLRPDLSILRRRKRETMVKKAALGFRVFGCLFCLISLSVMAADKNQGWALDSFNRYKEFRRKLGRKWGGGRRGKKVG